MGSQPLDWQSQQKYNPDEAEFISPTGDKPEESESAGFDDDDLWDADLPPRSTVLETPPPFSPGPPTRPFAIPLVLAAAALLLGITFFALLWYGHAAKTPVTSTSTVQPEPVLAPPPAPPPPVVPAPSPAAEPPPSAPVKEPVAQPVPEPEPPPPVPSPIVEPESPPPTPAAPIEPKPKAAEPVQERPPLPSSEVFTSSEVKVIPPAEEAPSPPEETVVAETPALPQAVQEPPKQRPAEPVNSEPASIVEKARHDAEAAQAEAKRRFSSAQDPESSQEYFKGSRLMQRAVQCEKTLDLKGAEAHYIDARKCFKNARPTAQHHW
jgi:hypothetical protein